MKGLVIAGVVLLVAGIASLVTGGFSFSHQKKDVDAGPIQISHESTKHVPVTPLSAALSSSQVWGLSLQEPAPSSGQHSMQIIHFIHLASTQIQ